MASPGLRPAAIDTTAKLAPGPTAYLPSSSNLLAESDREQDDDALVPSFTPSKQATNAPKASYWDDAFHSSTPTPKPPPRLAPMPKSPPSAATARSPPPPLIISTHRDTSTPTTPIVAPGVSLEHLMGTTKSKCRYAAFNTHSRSLSYSQAHSHHGNNIFSVASDTVAHRNGAVGSSSPSLGSLSTMGTESGLDTRYNPDHDSLDITTAATVPLGATRSYSSSILPHTSPAAVRSSFQLHHQHHHNSNARHSHGQQQQGQPQLHRHHHRPHLNPLLTPSSSQTSLFSNLPSPLTRSSLSSANIFRDPPLTAAQSGISSWVSSQSVSKPADQNISEASALQQHHYHQQQQQQEQEQEQEQDQVPFSDVSSNVAADQGHATLMTTTTTTTAAPNLASSAVAPTSSQRKIYPGLKNTVGPYKLLHSIGQGSFSEVKMAVDTRSGDHVAIKLMSRAMIQSSDRLGISVRRESDLLKSIQHPNIVGFREVVETSLQMCIVLDYASGGELFEFVADKRVKASEQDMQYIFAQIVDAVDYLHQHNIVHRDLKLESKCKTIS
ncbi:hypothetical protein EDD11_002910 [Mortierella claussenii]|nr:hypothetical protein EDD11_002910 [Mortierella claussenii]